MVVVVFVGGVISGVVGAGFGLGGGWLFEFDAAGGLSRGGVVCWLEAGGWLAGGVTAGVLIGLLPVSLAGFPASPPTVVSL
ncbi:MAG: hypothetical protein FD129_1072, partial [bacterium]